MSTPPIRTGPVILALWLVMFTLASQFLVVAPILPRIGEALDVPSDVLGTLVTGYAMAVAGFAVVAGPVSDRYGRRLVLRIGTAWMAVALLATAFARDYATLLTLRVLAGAASGILSGATVAYVGDVIPYQQRGRALGLVMSGMAFGQIAGIPAGTMLSDALDYRAPFVAFGLLMIPATLGTWFVLPASPVANEGKLDVGTALRGYAELLRTPSIIAVSLASTAMMWSVSTFIVYQPKWLEDELAATSHEIAFMFLVGGLANAIMGPVAGRLSDSIGRKGLVIVGSVGLGVMMIIVPQLTSMMYVYPVVFVTMALVGARVGPLNAWMTALVDARRRGSLMSLTMATGQAGFAVGAAVAGPAYVRYGYTSNAWLGVAGAIAAALLLLGVPEPARET